MWNLLPAKAEDSRDGRVDGGQDVGDHVHLRDALHEDLALVAAPLQVGEVAVDGFVHVAYQPRISINTPTASVVRYRTLPILKLLLHNRIISIRINLILLQPRPQPSDDILPLYPPMLPRLALSNSIAGRLQRIDPFAYSFDFFDFLCAVDGKDLTCFLEALVWELGEGDLGGVCEGGAASARGDGVLAFGFEESAFASGGVDEVGVWVGGLRV